MAAFPGKPQLLCPVSAVKDERILATAPTRPRDNRDLNTRNPHTSTIYELPKGNFVFDAGTCWWNLVLSTPPGFMNPPRRDFKPDPRVQRITANLLKRMIQGKE